MGMVALTYKVMPDSDVDDVSAEDIPLKARINNMPEIK